MLSAIYNGAIYPNFICIFPAKNDIIVKENEQKMREQSRMEEPNMMKRMMAECRAAGLSASDVSSRFKIPAGVVTRWERGELRPPAWVESMVRNFLADERRKNHLKSRRGQGTANVRQGWKR